MEKWYYSCGDFGFSQFFSVAFDNHNNIITPFLISELQITLEIKGFNLSLCCQRSWWTEPHKGGVR